jgi:acyl carrier protein
MEAIQALLRHIGVAEAELGGPDIRLRADLALDSTETSALELELRESFGVRVDLWDARDYTVGELAALVGGGQ